VATQHLLESVRVSGVRDLREQPDVLALLPGETAAVLGGTPVDPRLPAALGVARSDGAVPALVSPAVADVAREGALTLQVGGNVPLRVIGTVDGFPGVATGRPLVVVDRSLLAQATGQSWVPNRLVLAGAGADPGAVTAAVPVSGDEAVVRLDLLEQLRDQPYVTSTVRGYALGGVVGVVSCALVVLLTLTLLAPARTRVLAYARTLGLGRRGADAVVAVEVLPLFLVALLAGLVVGLGLAALVLPGMDLQPFTGGRGQPEVTVDAGRVAVGAALVALVMAGVVLLVTRVGRRASPAELLRMGEHDER
nr:hypothetical protein [Actinomycetes bacterium]